MKIAAHVTFYYVEERLKYVSEVIDGLLGIPHDVTVFVYSNRQLDAYRHAPNVKVITYDYAQKGQWRYRDIWHKTKLFRFLVHPSPLKHRLRLTRFTNPFYLTWENRRRVKASVDRFDVQLYLEDDIAFTSTSFEYWLKYKELCLRHGYNLGFLRVENSESRDLWLSDLKTSPERIVELEGTKFVLNDVNPYCGFWIYDRTELAKFTRSPEWRWKFRGYGLREKSAVGWHGIGMNRYRGTLVPLLRNGSGYQTDPACGVRHLPNNYIGHAEFCRIRFPLKLEGVGS